ncbi:MAG: FAD-dependent oxidoreductase [Bacteroidetes bacterium]|nr:FAD-dependent oxidoreductase [Bacteroidota bacterium]
MKHSKTSLLRIFQQSFYSSGTGSNPSRRKFVKQTILGAGAALVGCTWLESFAVSNPRIAILGAGVAGLHSALLLKDKGIDFSIYEASKRAGGRMYSQKDLMGEGIVTELGAEFIDSTHADLLQLAKRFQLPLLDTEQDIPLEKYIFYFEGKKFSCKDLIEALSPFATSIQNDIDSLPELIRYNDYGNAKQWDQMSIMDYCKSKGMQGWLLALIDVAFTTEYGLDASEQSSINMLFCSILICLVVVFLAKVTSGTK